MSEDINVRRWFHEESAVESAIDDTSIGAIINNELSPSKNLDDNEIITGRRNIMHQNEVY